LIGKNIEVKECGTEDYPDSRVIRRYIGEGSTNQNGSNPDSTSAQLEESLHTLDEQKLDKGFCGH
jgi:hypothetical protein